MGANPFVWVPVVTPTPVPQPGAQVWDGRVVGSGLHSSSDQFTTDTLASGKWALWNHGGNLSASVNTTERCMVLSALGNGVADWSGVYQPVPLTGGVASPAFTFAAQFGFDSVMGTGQFNPFAGLGIFTDATQAAGAGASWGDIEIERVADDASGALLSGANWPLRIRDGVSYGGATGFDTRNYYCQPTMLWLRARITIVATLNWTIAGDWSTDGVNWNEWRSNVGNNSRTRATAGLTAKHFGLTFLQFPASVSRVKVYNFRVWNGVNAFNSVPRNGGYLNV